jgi:hypothetical protein
VEELCCGKLVLIATVGGSCGDASLRSLESKLILEELNANGTQLMMKTCQGHFLAYQPPIPQVPSYFNNKINLDLAFPGE